MLKIGSLSELTGIDTKIKVAGFQRLYSKWLWLLMAVYKPSFAVAGAISALPGMPIDIHILVLILFAAAVLGDSCNYMIGHFFGRKLFHNPNSRIFKQSYLDKTHEFYKKYGGKTIILARFVPIVRTFAPFIAGMGKMHYYYFMIYNLIGGAIWVVLFCYAGYFFGDLPFVQENLKLLIIAIIFISILPAIIEILRAKLGSKQ
ncbi:DedA family protein [Bacteroides thetaiotaomicron]|uniref:DedA family protein n=1 Tax=Bacteroides thetaiotaomicron TaxID=818 RepID=UPI002FEE46E2